MNKRLSLNTISTKLQRIAELAKQMPNQALTTLSHHIDVEFLREAYHRVRKDGAVGIDGQTAQEYAEQLEGNLQSLLNRFKAGTYKAPPVKRVYIPKGDKGKEKRPIGIPTFEDKILQKAVVMVLNAVYEQDFMDCSYGFRPKRNQHQALDTLWKALSDEGGIVLELDIAKFFDSVDFQCLRQMLDQRVRDGVLRKAINKWLKAGVMTEGQVSRPEKGTPQGGVVSPLLANIYLHEVLDKWFEREVKPRLEGKGTLVRFADDAVLVFTNEIDAQRVMKVLPKRMGKYGLTLHPEKTRIVRFYRPKRKPGKGSRDPKEHESFDFLGFTHYWGAGRRGRWVVKRKTAKGRFKRALSNIHQWCKRNLHMRVKEQCKILSMKLKGHYNYYGVTGNYKALAMFHHMVKRTWRYWLNRRSQKRKMPWSRFRKLLKQHALPRAYVAQSIYRNAANP